MWFVFSATIAGGSCNRFAWTIYPILFTVGFIPDAGIRSLFSYATGRLQTKRSKPGIVTRVEGVAGSLARFVKLTEGRYANITKSIPLDVIDGIDYITRYRLEEAGIYEVQNLATANPILLHIEAPFGIYQTIDWVGQAQLCTVVGLERFLIFKEINIRTVFDLERAVLSLKSTSAIRRFVGGILLITTTSLLEIESLNNAGTRFPDMAGAKAQGISATLYMEWASKAILEDASYRVRLPDPAGPHIPSNYRVFPVEIPSNLRSLGKFRITEDGEEELLGIFEIDKEIDSSIKHMVRLIMDDLHVMRLRQIWESIGRILGVDAATLDDSEDTFLGA